MDYKEIQKARGILRLPSKATLEEIKAAFRKLSFRHHPDRQSPSGRGPGAAKMREIIRARDTLLKYLASYRYFFSEEEFRKHLGPEFTSSLDQFYLDWF